LVTVPAFAELVVVRVVVRVVVHVVVRVVVRVVVDPPEYFFSYHKYKII